MGSSLAQLELGWSTRSRSKRVGTSFARDNGLWLGSGLESFSTAARLSVYRPRGTALEIIVDHVDPLRRKEASEDARDSSIEEPVAPFPVGTVRYTSTDRLHGSGSDEGLFLCESNHLALWSGELPCWG